MSRLESLPFLGRGWDGEVLGPFHLVPFLVLLEVCLAQGRTNTTNLGLP